MRQCVIILSLVLPSYLFGQLTDTTVNVNSMDSNPEKPYNLNWTDTILPKINTISFARVAPECFRYKRNKRKMVPFNKTKSGDICYQESLINSTLVYFTQNDSIIDTLCSIEKIDFNRIYDEVAIETTDFEDVYRAALGKRESNVINMCYEPRHIILFKDSSENILGICEVCFECGNTTLAFECAELINIYEDDYFILKKLFRKYELIESTKKH